MNTGNGYDPAAAELARDAAIEQVDEHAARAWRAACDDVIRQCAATVDLFTSDRVAYLLDRLDVDTHDDRAIGPRMRAAKRAGLIEATPDFRPSVRVSRHRGPVRVWRSLVR